MERSGSDTHAAATAEQSALSEHNSNTSTVLTHVPRHKKLKNILDVFVKKQLLGRGSCWEQDHLNEQTEGRFMRKFFTEESFLELV